MGGRLASNGVLRRVRRRKESEQKEEKKKEKKRGRQKQAGRGKLTGITCQAATAGNEEEKRGRLPALEGKEAASRKDGRSSRDRRKAASTLRRKATARVAGSRQGGASHKARGGKCLNEARGEDVL